MSEEELTFNEVLIEICDQEGWKTKDELYSNIQKIKLKDYDNKSPLFISRAMDFKNSWLQIKGMLKTTIHSIFPEEAEENKNLKRLVTNYYGKVDLAQQFLIHQPVYYDKYRNWWKWNKNLLKWEVCDETDILNLVNDVCETNTVSAKDKNEILESLRQQSRKNKPIEIKKTWIQFKDVIVDVITGEKVEASPKYFVTNPIPYELHKENFEGTPIMDKIFTEWVGEENIKTLYQIIAYSMIPDYPLNRIFCFIGDGMNGKSKFLELLRKFIGAENCCSTELDTLLTSRFEVTRLHKKLVCQMGETNFNEMNKTSILKKLSGGDLIGFEYKRKDPFEDINYAKILIATNNLPVTTDKTIGFYRRWMIIDFPNRFSEKKDILGEIPDEEYQSLALKSLALLKDLLTDRQFHKEGTIEERTKRYEDRSNPMQKFIEEFFTMDDVDAFITKNSFERRLNDWLSENRHRAMASKTIQKWMVSQGFEDARDYIDWDTNGTLTKKLVRTWRGLKEKC